MQRILIVLQKELSDNLRDRRTLANTLLAALLGPLMLFMLLTVIGSTVGNQTERPLELPVVGGEHAPGLLAFLAQRNVIAVAAPADPEAAVRLGDADVILVLDANYAAQLEAGLPAPIRLIFDSSRQATSSAVSRTRLTLEAYAALLGSQRLQARGVSPSLANPLVIEQADLATPEGQAAQLLNILPYFLIFAIFVGGLSLTVDVTAGERERGSLEPLLINPVARAELVLGKLLAALIPTAISVLISLAGFAAVVNFSSIGSQLGVRLSLSLPTLTAIFLITIPMMILAGALQMIIATASRTVKEANSYLGFLPLIPALPGLFLAFVPIRAELWMMAIPTFGQQLLINQLMRGEAVNLGFVTVSTLVTIVVGMALIVVAIMQFGRERVLFGRGTG
ncbi:MAG: ABC transporter permease [Oscillochloridaceae bacterium umkhey_bin13]